MTRQVNIHDAKTQFSKLIELTGHALEEKSTSGDENRPCCRVTTRL